MDIHKPKPWRGVREFLKEYVIIVVGVLTALAAEQVVEQLHWRHEVHVARAALAFDMKRLVGGAAAQDEHTACTALHLREIGVALDQAAATHRLPPLGWSGVPPQASWSLRSWSALNSGQTLAHFPNREQILLAGLASYSDRMKQFQMAELDDWATLMLLSGPGRPIGDTEIGAARVAMAHAYRDAWNLRFLARQMETMVAETGLITRGEIQASYREGVGLRATTPFCDPRPPPPAKAADALERGLLGPAQRPGDERVTNPGVGKAITVER